ncbi:MAG: hypothetical protein ACM33V_06700 [Chloroflexota bacterium]
MKHFSTFVIITVVALVVSACGAEPAAPTLSSADIAGTAQAAALTMIAQTQAAIPTNTPPPPTETASPTLPATNTPLPLPTQDLSIPLPTDTKAPSGDPCDTRQLAPKKGKSTIIRIWNSTKTPVTVSIYLNETKGHGECGYRSYNLAKNADVVITDLVYGCYNLWAWNTSGKPNFNSGGYGCINNPDKWTFIIGTATIKFNGP